MDERAAVQRFVGRFLPRENVLGFSDDAAALSMGEDYLVVTTDAVSEGAHRAPGMPLESLGWMCAAANLSDLAAKGASPLGFTLDILAPSLSSEDVDQLSRGLARCLDRFEVELLGGDTKPAGEIVLAGTAIGRVAKNALLKRAGALPGDIACVIGDIGGAQAVLAALRRGDEVKDRFALDEPLPRLSEGIALAKARVATSCTDVSDGLAVSLSQIADLSKVGMRIDEARLPLHPAIRAFSVDENERRELALHGGGDYALVATVPERQLEAAARAVSEAGGDFAPIGEVTEARALVLVADDGERAIEARGYEHAFSAVNY